MHYIEQFLEKRAAGLPGSTIAKIYLSTILGGAGTGAGIGLGIGGLKALYDQLTNDKKDFNGKKNLKRLLKKGLVAGSLTGGAVGLGGGLITHGATDLLHNIGPDISSILISSGMEAGAKGFSEALKHGLKK